MEHIFSIWPTISDLAEDAKVPYPTAAAWKQRGSIPAKHDLALVEAASRRGAVLTLEMLAKARMLSAPAAEAS